MPAPVAPPSVPPSPVLVVVREVDEDVYILRFEKGAATYEFTEMSAVQAYLRRISDEEFAGEVCDMVHNFRAAAVNLDERRVVSIPTETERALDRLIRGEAGAEDPYRFFLTPSQQKRQARGFKVHVERFPGESEDDRFHIV